MTIGGRQSIVLVLKVSEIDRSLDRDRIVGEKRFFIWVNLFESDDRSAKGLRYKGGAFFVGDAIIVRLVVLQNQSGNVITGQLGHA